MRGTLGLAEEKEEQTAKKAGQFGQKRRLTPDTCILPLAEGGEFEATNGGARRIEVIAYWRENTFRLQIIRGDRRKSGYTLTSGWTMGVIDRLQTPDFCVVV